VPGTTLINEPLVGSMVLALSAWTLPKAEQERAKKECSRADDASRRFACRAQLSFLLSRTSPSCATLATSNPSRVKIEPRAKPREPVMIGLSCA
jgi:hypothetical protein